ncbi:DEAD/DEAH box helicase [Nocardioides alcanivorans]|uniref:DEAD/DEAH box helicase n=1 Tax=Nocardioides alcanivorans TaxID=2897352 RepID=UPI001F1D9CCE|nr:type ISP restriction/modification enzyme [Nocardioides alcanivorans]
MREDAGVPTTIHDLLDQLRSTALDERDKGDRFERLVRSYLLTDPEWTAKFSDVWLWSDWEGRPAGVPDIGVDLVAANRDSDTFSAIQCKFYDEGQKVSKAHIDSFLAATMRPEFQITTRYVFDTSAGWTGNVEKEVQGVVQRVDIGYLDDAAIDWDQFRWETPEVVVPTGAKELFPHQARALENVRAGFNAHNRGKLIMACGTGKTFTSLRIAEDLVGEGGSVLFLVPSIQLLSQSLREWMANTTLSIRPFAVCSDVRVGRQNSDDADMSTIDLTEPATTDATTLLARMSVGKYAQPRMTVVFSTYQSIDVIIEAQKQGLAAFDLVVCDEAHRTTGATLAGQDDSAFVKVHDAQALRAAKRLYMTATPRVFGDEVKARAKDADAVLADMGDETIYGPEFHRLGFGDAVEIGRLTDYKVLVLAVDEQYVADNFQQAMAESGEIKLDDAAKLIGCWNGLAKNFGPTDALGHDTGTVNRAPMRTAVAFAKDIRSSKAATAAFPPLVDRAIIDLPDARTPLKVEARHVDGTMRISERNAHLAWLKSNPSDTTCRILTNAKCLSEGVDVPALDAVLFLTPRGSQVDVVQSVGRVMRKAPGKELGYIILPVVVPSGVAPEVALADNERYKVVWQVLQALRSHDERFHALVNKIELNKAKPTDKLEIISITTPVGDGDRDGATPQEGKEYAQGDTTQAFMEFATEAFRDAMYARIVKKVGERRYWETWAKDVADIAAAHVTRINGLLADVNSPQSAEFEVFLAGLRANLNDNISRAEAVDMLAQHMVTRPIFEALFDGYDFATTNPVAKIMELMLASLDEHPLGAENQTLEGFYDSVRRRVAGVDNAEGKQRILVELYDKFFAVAFKKTVDKLGIVYTPIEIVDFILRSADAVLRQEFGQGLTDEGVTILDPFTGTGTFLVRLLQSGLIEPHDLARKYATEMYASEILLLAYYIACVNIEQTYAEQIAAIDPTQAAEPFNGLILTDTFQSWEPHDRTDDELFVENNARLQRLKNLDITVIVGNPPYSSGQDSANDNNANESYPALDAEIRDTYAKLSTATNKNSLYDSYIRAIKWATLRIKDRGVIAFVTNGGFLDSNTADGMRKTLADEFSAIHIYNLRGNQRTAGEQSRKEGGKVFGAGSRATVAITVLVKDPGATGPTKVHYSEVGDYLTREEKLGQVADSIDVTRLATLEIEPNEHGDWINQRREDFGNFPTLSAVFGTTAYGVLTSRDSWVYQSSEADLLSNVKAFLKAFHESVATEQRVMDSRRMSWSESLEKAWGQRRSPALDPSQVRVALYRPFFRQFLYYDGLLIHRRGVTPRLAPVPEVRNPGYYVLNPGAAKPFSLVMTEIVPDVALFGSNSGQWCTRYSYERVDDSGMLDLGDSEEVIDGYRRIDNITDDALARFQAAYPGQAISKDDIFFYVYGLLHSTEYRETYAADLRKMLPRIPMVRDFARFAEAGRRLSDLHVGYEAVGPYPLEGLDVEPTGDPYDFFAVGDKKMRFAKPTAEQKAAGERHDRTVIYYNDRITLSGIPDDAYRYMLGSRSAIEWIIDRYYVKTDKKSGIVNDPNDWSREVGDPRYIVDLLARIVTVSVETLKIVDGLPPLDIIEGA